MPFLRPNHCLEATVAMKQNTTRPVTGEDAASSTGGVQ